MTDQWQSVTLKDDVFPDHPGMKVFVRASSEAVEVGIHRPDMPENNQYNQGIWLVAYVELYNGQLRVVPFEGADYESGEAIDLWEIGG